MGPPIIKPAGMMPFYTGADREMKQLMLRHAFQFVKSVIFIVGTQNFRSQKAVEKICGTRVGSRTDARGRENFIYQITAPTCNDSR